MAENITKKCRACEIDFSRLENKTKKKTDNYKFPEGIPISTEMKKNVKLFMGKHK